MRIILAIGALLVIAASSAQSQAAVTGRWRAVLLYSNGDSREITMELAAAGAAVTGTVAGASIRDGRINGNTVTLVTGNLGNPSLEATLTGELDGDEIVFKSRGLVQFP